MKKIDYAIGGLVGFFAGVALVPTAYAVGVHNAAVLLALPWMGAVCIVLGVGLGGFLSRWIPMFAQLGKFGAIGILNTAIDFAVLNILSKTLGITAGLVLGGVNMPGFIIAVINSYFWNKLWVFRDKTKAESLLAGFPRFFAITFIGVLINSGLIIALTTYTSFLSGIPAGTRLNIAKAAATLITLVWNFAGYKLMVFHTAPDPTA